MFFNHAIAILALPLLLHGSIKCVSGHCMMYQRRMDQQWMDGPASEYQRQSDWIPVGSKLIGGWLCCNATFRLERVLNALLYTSLRVPVCHRNRSKESLTICCASHVTRSLACNLPLHSRNFRFDSLNLPPC